MENNCIEPLIVRIRKEMAVLSKDINKVLKLDYNCCRVDYICNSSIDEDDSIKIELETNEMILTFLTTSKSVFIKMDLDSIIKIMNKTIHSEKKEDKIKDIFEDAKDNYIQDLSVLKLEHIYIR